MKLHCQKSENEIWRLILFNTNINLKRLYRQSFLVWLTWMECHPTHQKVGDSIPSQGTYLGCGFDLWLGHMCEATNRCFSHINVCVCVSLSPLSSLSKIKKNILKIFDRQEFYHSLIHSIYEEANHCGKALKKKITLTSGVHNRIKAKFEPF